MSNRYLEISVSNQPSNGKMSFREGMSNLIFQIPAMEGNLIPSSVKICGKIQFFKDGTGTTPSAPMSVDERLGVYGAFESLTTRSIRHQQTIEQVRHYAHMLSNYLPLTSSVKDNISSMSNRALTFPNWSGFNKSVVYSDSPQEFCLSLPCGLLNGTEDIPLSNSALGGLEIVIALASDSQMIFTNTNDASSIVDAFYEFSDLKLLCEVQEGVVSNKPNFTYQSISSYYDTINSSNANVSFNLGLSKVRSVFSSFVPSSYLNNRSQNGYSTVMITNTDDNVANVKKLVWQKGGALYPKMFENNSVVRDSPQTILSDPVILKDYVSAVKSFKNNMRNCLSLENTSRDFTTKQVTGGDLNKELTQYTTIPNTGQIFGLGINYDALGGEGTDFRDENWGMNIQSDLTTDNPHSVFIFVNSEQSVFFNQNGIQVQQ
tara:strand:+ start:515 stop:1810 length:1296 start_codon:yes stop_codon:yes gene_type:complete